eukprot:5087844-Amphidinium_carterae.1
MAVCQASSRRRSSVASSPMRTTSGTACPPIVRGLNLRVCCRQLIAQFKTLQVALRDRCSGLNRT